MKSLLQAFISLEFATTQSDDAGKPINVDLLLVHRPILSGDQVITCQTITRYARFNAQFAWILTHLYKGKSSLVNVFAFGMEFAYGLVAWEQDIKLPIS